MDKFYIKKLLGNIENPTILEIGCNDGQDTLEFIEAFTQIKIHCFEPDQRAYTDFISKVNFEGCKIYNIAISNVDGETEFFMSDSNLQNPGTPTCVGNGWHKSGSIKEPKKHKQIHPWCKFDKKVKVKTMKLDTWIQDKSIDIIDFVWADVQGAEEEMISGGLDTFNKKVKYLYTEYSQVELYDGNSSIERITSLLPDFNLIKVMQNDILLKNRNM